MILWFLVADPGALGADPERLVADPATVVADPAVADPDPQSLIGRLSLVVRPGAPSSVLAPSSKAR